MPIPGGQNIVVSGFYGDACGDSGEARRVSDADRTEMREVPPREYANVCPALFREGVVC